MENAEEVLNQEQENIEEVENTPTEDSEIIDVTFDNEESQPQTENEDAPEWVKDLRKGRREDKKTIKELQKKLEEFEKKKEAANLPKKPTLAECDYDEELYEQKLGEFHLEKQKYDAQKRKQEESEQTQQEQFSKKIADYNAEKQKLKLSNYGEYEAFVESELNIEQQKILLNVAKNAPLLVYALGKNEAKLNSLAQISDNTLFAAELARVEASLRTTRDKKPPVPEKQISVAGGGSFNDSKLDRLRAEAEKTGDFTKVLEYKRLNKK